MHLDSTDNDTNDLKLKNELKSSKLEKCPDHIKFGTNRKSGEANWLLYSMRIRFPGDVDRPWWDERDRFPWGDLNKMLPRLCTSRTWKTNEIINFFEKLCFEKENHWRAHTGNSLREWLSVQPHNKRIICRVGLRLEEPEQFSISVVFLDIKKLYQ